MQLAAYRDQNRILLYNVYIETNSCENAGSSIRLEGSKTVRWPISKLIAISRYIIYEIMKIVHGSKHKTQTGDLINMALVGVGVGAVLLYYIKSAQQ